MKKVTKSVIGLILAFILAALTYQVTRADVVWEPEDSFYQNNSSKCERLERMYITDGPEGTVVLWKSPKSQVKIKTFENSTEIYIPYSYTDKKGVLWGLYEGDGSGWFRMSDLLLKYDCIAFCEEHESEFKEYTGEFYDYEPEGMEEIVAWTFPDSGEISFKTKDLDGYHNITYTYTDEDGRLWGYYSYVDVNFAYVTNKWNNRTPWICLSDPTNENIEKNNYNQPTIIPAAAANTADSSSAEVHATSPYLLLAAAVFLLITVTAVLICLFWKRNQKNA